MQLIGYVATNTSFCCFGVCTQKHFFRLHSPVFRAVIASCSKFESSNWIPSCYWLRAVHIAAARCLGKDETSLWCYFFCTPRFSFVLSAIINEQSESIAKQEVLGRTNRLLSLIRHGPHWERRVQQFYCCVCIRYHGNVSAEPLPSNDRGIFTEPFPSNDRGIFTELLPSNDKGTFTEPLPGNDRGDTHTDSKVIS
jgi:hypothetical protein